ncbi:SHOCT domain-containing protein [Weissella cibaria]|uniref:SHOCT domain-containing protein n=1 Tax=Weissella cibaria TaxID=137591 RepID=UPI00223ADDDD|nr:SHOCT domain-containing protein [Weissella cibaria]MCT0011331.1 SHOCT domain-containing protein [Weissella cibaria]MCT0950992.1 SHOCT domain-containing protein [Weissella cibaria]
MGFDPLNISAKKDAKAKLEKLVSDHNYETQRLTEEFVELRSEREQLVVYLRQVESIINAIKNTPERFNKDIQTLSLSLERYDKLLKEAENASADIQKGAGAGLAAGLATGGAVAAFGGTALTAVAMSIGTASTGAAISGLTGAAATNAALAWLGGGAVAAGGAGMAGGSALLALTGPIGWAIGGASAIATGIWARGKNADAAEDMLKQAASVQAGINSVKAITSEVRERTKLVTRTYVDLSGRISVASSWPDDFDDFTDSQVDLAGALVNNALSAEKILNSKLGEDGKFHEQETEESKSAKSDKGDYFEEKMEKLERLKDKGILTEEEYQSKRAEYINSL